MRVEERQCHVVERARPRQQIEGLEHEADHLVAIVRERVGGEPAKLAAFDLERAGGRRVEGADKVHEGRFAGARMAGDGEIFALVHISR